MEKRWFFSLRKLVERLFAGAFLSKKRGAGGIEFATFRDFQPGDSVRTIAHKQSLLRSRFVVKDRVIEKGMTCLFVVDCSASIDYGPSGVAKKEIQLLMMDILAPAIARNNNQVGFVLVTNTIEKFFEPRFGESEVFERLKFISGFKPKSPKTDLNSVFKEIIGRSVKADLVFIVSDFYSVEDFVDSLRLLSGLYDVILMILKDRFETTTFPLVKGGMFAFRDMETGEFFWGEAPDKISNTKLFRSLGLDYVLLRTHEPIDEWVRRLVIIFEERKKWRKL